MYYGIASKISVKKYYITSAISHVILFGEIWTIEKKVLVIFIRIKIKNFVRIKKVTAFICRMNLESLEIISTEKNQQ